MKDDQKIKDALTLQVLEAEDVTRTLAEETLLILDQFAKDSSKVTKEIILSMYISKFIHELVLDSFSDEIITGKSKDIRYEQAKNSFNSLKTNLEYSISSGFQNGLSEYAGQPVGYYCLIRATPEPTNELLM